MFEINEAVVLAAAVLVSAALATELFGYVLRMAVLPWYFLHILTTFNPSFLKNTPNMIRTKKKKAVFKLLLKSSLLSSFLSFFPFKLNEA